MLDKHKPDKAKQVKFVTEHLARQRTRSSTEEELQSHLERIEKREMETQIASSKAKDHRQDQVRQAPAAHQAHNAVFIATFAKRAKEVALAT
jgi:hypothetical protein